MSWALFAVIQLSIVTVGVTVAFWLRNRELKKRYGVLEQASAHASTAVEAARDQLTQGTDAWFNERLGSLTEEDEVTTIQRMVLENEREPSAEFDDKLRKQLSSTESAQRALNAALDAAVPDIADDDATQEEEDLKELLQQFTKESRGMTSDIQNLRSENKMLREQLGVDPAPETHDTSALPAEDEPGSVDEAPEAEEHDQQVEDDPPEIENDPPEVEEPQAEAEIEQPEEEEDAA